jgi:mono/diheme cytochrome c family protein
MRSAAVALALLSLVAAACEDVFPELDLQRMDAQRKARAYAPSELFSDGRAMRPPPEGAVRADRIVGRPLYTDGVSGGRYADRIPLPVTRALLARGRDRFDVYCAACHGASGDGQSEVAIRMELRRPPSLVDEPARSFPPGRVYQVIDEGYGLMRSYADDLSLEERWGVVAYVGALAVAHAAPLAALPPSVRTEAERALSEQP